MTEWTLPTKSEDQISHEAIMENSMSVVEKLRALLAEAREALVRAENRMMLPPHQVPDAIERIDAALAEPVQEDEALRVWKMVAKQKQEERDEARAEVARLKKLMEDRWAECHDGSEQACCKSHE